MPNGTDSGGAGGGSSRENIAYVRQMLAELAQVARKERADLLAYLLEMAFTEASDLLTDRSGVIKGERNQSAGMAVKPARKV
ncbi:MAG: hypothetical protein KL863_23915 [Rhizobium sp.]|nr:hypothetical protein [Rhizobium sp.]